MAENSLLIMVAPNGARKQKTDHPNLPITIEDVIAEATACHHAGAAMLHAHIRDKDGKHSLDTGKYKALLDAMRETLPDMLCQITTEQAGVFTPQDQARCLIDVKPDYASVSIREITGDQSESHIKFGCHTLNAAADAGTHLQYILYGPEDLALLHRLYQNDQLPPCPVDVLFVLGRYSPDQRSTPDDLDPFLAEDRSFIRHWMVCAFGPQEYDVMAKAYAEGGQARIGFENNLWMKDGQLAQTNADLVSQLAQSFTPMHVDTARAIFT